MNKGLQWVLGICAVLLVAAVVFAIVAPFFLPRVTASVVGMGPGMMGRGREFGFGFGDSMPMFRRSGIMGFGFPFLGGAMILGPLVVIGLVIVLGAVWLSNRRQSAPAVPPPAAPAAPVAPAVATTPCAHCGEPLQAGWKVCPYCGEKI
jgi:hypothetical protein